VRHPLLAPAAALLAAGLALFAPTSPAAAEPSLVVDGHRGLDLVSVRAPHHHTESLRLGRAYSPVVASPSGRILAARSVRDGRHRLVVGADGPQRALATTPACLSTVAISPDGSQVTWAAVPQDDQGCPFAEVVHLLDVDTGTRVDLAAPPRSGWFRTPPSFSPDGSRVTLLGLTRHEHWLMRVFDTATGQRLRQLTDHLPTDVPAADGAVVVRRTDGLPGGRRCRLFTLDTGSDAEPSCWDADLRLTGPQAAAVTASPDGTRLAWVDASTGKPHLVLAPTVDPAADVDLGRIHNGPGRPSLTWVGNRHLLARSPEDDQRTLIRAHDGRAVWPHAPITYGWVR
jgi:hypothetical protein